MSRQYYPCKPISFIIRNIDSDAILIWDKSCQNISHISFTSSISSCTSKSCPLFPCKASSHIPWSHLPDIRTLQSQEEYTTPSAWSSGRCPSRRWTEYRTATYHPCNYLIQCHAHINISPYPLWSHSSNRYNSWLDRLRSEIWQVGSMAFGWRWVQRWLWLGK